MTHKSLSFSLISIFQTFPFPSCSKVCTTSQIHSKCKEPNGPSWAKRISHPSYVGYWGSSAWASSCEIFQSRHRACSSIGRDWKSTHVFDVLTVVYIEKYDIANPLIMSWIAFLRQVLPHLLDIGTWEKKCLFFHYIKNSWMAPSILLEYWRLWDHN